MRRQAGAESGAGKTELVRCVIDTANDPHEIGLDENLTREARHLVGQFAPSSAKRGKVDANGDWTSLYSAILF